MPVQTPNPPPGPPPQKPERLRADMPQIPGVNAAPPRPASGVDDATIARLVQLGALAAAVVLLGAAFLWWIKRPAPAAAESAASDAAAETSAPPPATMDAAETTGPVVAATDAELAAPWSSKQFVFVKPLTHEKLDALVIRLPGGQLWAFALREPYGRCDLELVADIAKLAKRYGYRASHPMLASPCSGTIYDPTKVGAIGGYIYARGEIVHGTGVRPPISIDVIEKDHAILADGIE